MAVEGLDAILRKLPFFDDLAPEEQLLISGCARNHRFDAGQYIFREGQAADEFFILRHGQVALETTNPGRAPLVISTLGENEVVGAAWLVPPYKWTYDARARVLTRAIGIDAACLRGKSEADPALGYKLMKLFLPTLVKQLHDTQMQVLDVYQGR